MVVVVDSAEKSYVFKAFDDLGIPYIKETIYAALEPCDKIPIYVEGVLTCITKEEKKTLEEMEFKVEIDNLACNKCPKSPKRVGDFTNDSRSFIAERKRVDDFYASMADGRLYHQLRTMYQYCQGLKILILEGMSNHEYIRDGFNPFSDFNDKEMDLKTKSPLEQLILMHPDKKEWIMGTIKDMASCEVALVQTKNVQETALIIQQISEGAGTEPKIRDVPKKISGLTLEETMLTVIPRIGKVRAQNLIAEYGSLGELITDIRKLTPEEANKRTITKILKEIFS